jgi:hypothetical protein
MSPQLVWIAIGVALLVVVIALIAVSLRRNRRTQELRTRFGSESDRTVQRNDAVSNAESARAERARRVERLRIKPLAVDDSARFTAAWRHIQTRFVDDPGSAVTEADRLVGEVMHTRGYPVGNFEQRVDDISPDHPTVVMHYRAAREITVQHERERASTEDLRQAMVHYRTLFQDLLAPAPEPRSTVDQEPVAMNK